MNACDCEEPELAINPERECSVCGGFIPFGGPGQDDDIRDFLAWSDSMKIAADDDDAPREAWSVAKPQPSADGSRPKSTKYEHGELPVTDAFWQATEPKKARR